MSLTRFDFVNILLVIVLWVLFVVLCGFMSQKWHNFKVEQCYRINDDGARLDCMRRV